MKPRPASPALLGAFTAVYLFWGGTFLAIRYAVADVPPLLTIAVRCAGGAAILWGWMAWRGRLARVSGEEWRTAVLAGALLFIGCHGLLAWAEQRISSGEAALFMTGIPLWLVVLSALRERRFPSGRVVGGLALGVLGVAVLSSGARWDGQMLDYVALMVSAFAWAAGSMVARHGARSESATLSTTLQLTAGAGWVIAASIVSGELAGWSPAAVTMRGAAALGFLILFGTVLGFGAYTWLLRVTTPARASSYAFVNPVVALALAWLVGDGVITGRTVVAAGMVLAAVLLTRDEVKAGRADTVIPSGARDLLGGLPGSGRADPSLRSG